MARVKLSALLVSMAGRYSGGVFRAWKGLTVLSSLPASVRNPNSTKQARVRSILSTASKYWASFTTGIRTDWATVASYLTDAWDSYDNEVGTHRIIRTPRGPYTPLGALTSVVGLMGSCGLYNPGDPAPAAPVSHTNPAPPWSLELSGTTAGIIITWYDPAIWGDLETDGKIRIWLATDDGTVFPQLNGYVAGGVQTYTITEAVPSGGDVARPLEPGFYYVQIDAVSLGGLRSAPSEVAVIELVDPV